MVGPPGKEGVCLLHGRKVSECGLPAGRRLLQPPPSGGRCGGSEEPVCGPRPWPSWLIYLGWTREGLGCGQAGRCRLDTARPSPCTFAWPFGTSDAPRIVQV